MKRNNELKRLLAGLLTLCLLLSCIPMALVSATEGDAASQNTEATEPVETTEATVQTEPETQPTTEPTVQTVPSTEPATQPTTPETKGDSSGVNTVKRGAPALTADNSGVGFSAGLYEDADRMVLLSQLTAEGSTLTGWEYNRSSISAADKYLGVTLSDLPMDGRYRLVVEMAPILYINQNSDPVQTGTTVSFTRNEPLTVNTDGKYTPKTYSLSNLTYLINAGTSTLTLGLPLRFDVNLWNKQDGGKLGNGTDPLLRVYLQEEQADGSFATVQNCDVNLLQATTSGKVNIVVRQNMYIIGGADASTTNMGANDSMRLIFSRFGETEYPGGHYNGQVQVKIKIPECTVNGNKYVMQYKDFSFRTSGGSSLYDSTFDPETNILTITAEDLYFSSGTLFWLTLEAPEGLKTIPGNYTLSGAVSVVSDGVTVASNRAFTINLDTNTKAILKMYQGSGNANAIERDTVQPFGNLAIQNDAAKENGSGPLEFLLTFDYNNTNAISVTTLNLMCNRDTEWIDIAYTLVDREGNPAYPDPVTGENQEFTMTVRNSQYNPGSSIGVRTFQTFTRSQLPVAEHREYYFKTIRYTMGNLPGNSKAYHYGAPSAPYSAGTIWGYVNVDAVPSVYPKNRLQVFQVNGDGTRTDLNLSITNTSVIDMGTKVPYGLESSTISDATVTAGDSVTIGGKIFVADYPYSSNNCLNDIRLGFLLPEGITVNAASVQATYAGGDLLMKQISYTPVGSGENLYIIEFEEGQKIGYYNEKLSSLATGSTMTFSVQLNSEKTISTQTLVLRECVFAAGVGRQNSSDGTYGDHAVVDTYDLNANGSTTDKVACFGNETTSSITFQTPPAQLEISDTLTKESGASGNALTLDSFADTVNYELRIACTEGGSATEFYYLLPVGKTAMDDESTFMKQCQADLKLKGPAKVNVINGTALKLLYSTTPITDYQSAQDITDWAETLPEGKTWEDVTVMKIISAETEIVNGTLNTISVPLGYAGEELDYERMAGMQINWSSRGYYNYQLGHNVSAGLHSTAGCTITLTYTPQDPIRFTLTAAKEGNPQGEGAVKSYSFELPQFVLAQQYSIRQITPYNVKLVDENYDFSTASSTEANENFRILISVKDTANQQAGSAPVAIVKDDAMVGNLQGNAAPEFVFTLENADTLSDIVTDRYVNLTLVGSNGVIIPVEITIKRELAAAEPTKSAIVAGQMYTPFEGEDSATVSCDSAFTAQFVTEYIPGNYTDHALVFEKAPVSGTRVMLIDWTDPAFLKYYHYSMDGSTTQIPLTAFAGMGSSADYAEPTSTALVTERLLFVVSFPDSGEAVRTNAVTLTKRIKTGTDESVPSKLTVTTVTDRVFTLTPVSQSVAVGEEFTLNYGSSCAVTDSRYTGRSLSLVLKPAGEAAFSADSRLKIGDTVYSLNSDGAFIIPLKAVQQGDVSITAQFFSNTMTAASVQAELWASDTANGAGPMMGIPVAGPVNIKINQVKLPSFEVMDMSTRLIHTEELSNVLVVEFRTMDATMITVELQKKTGADYVTQTTILESVNGKTAADAGQGVFYVDINPMTLGLSGSTPPGTYRLLFRIYNDNGSIEVSYNFIVAE